MKMLYQDDVLRVDGLTTQFTIIVTAIVSCILLPGAAMLGTFFVINV